MSGEWVEAVPVRQHAMSFLSSLPHVRRYEHLYGVRIGTTAQHEDTLENAFQLSAMLELAEFVASEVASPTPFGFAWEDVDAIRECARMAEEEWRGVHGENGDGPWHLAREAADRIATLLPPRKGEETG